MGRFIQLVIGPAGVGKSTYCKAIQDHGVATKRVIHVANLDPAAEFFQYNAAFDVKNLITLEAAMEDLGYGPNGGLVYCMEFLFKNIEWLKEEIDNFGEDEYIILDCPGQVELYSHLHIMHNLVTAITSWGYRVVSVYLLDALYVLEPSKFISGCMLSLSCMLQLELPHINVITKCDMADKKQLAMVLDQESAQMVHHMDLISNGKLRKLTEAMSTVIDDYMLVSFVLLDITDEDTIQEVLSRADDLMQYGEEIEQKDPKYDQYEQEVMDS